MEGNSFMLLDGDSLEKMSKLSPKSLESVKNDIQAFAKRRIEKAYANADTVDPDTISLPERQNTFDPVDYTEFYEMVSKLSDHDLVVSWIVKYLNQYFCIINGTSYEVVECEYGRIGDLKEYSPTPLMKSERQKIDSPLKYTVRTPAEVKLRLRKCSFFNEDGKKLDLYDVWSKSLEAREYTSRVCVPNDIEHDPLVLNTFVGLKANLEIVFDNRITSMTDVDATHDRIQNILHHVYNLAGCNDLYYNYLLDWLAYPIQTGCKTNVAVICQGGQGCGKTLFFTNFMGQKIYGERLFAKIAGGEQIGGDFNSHIVGKMFIAIEEPNKFGSSKLNKLKDLITSDVQEVNAKGKNQFFMDDYTNYAFTCNYIPEQMLEKDDRRYFIIQDSGKNCGDHEFFQELSEEMNNHYHEFYKFLKMRDIETFVFGKAPPQTKIKTKLLSLAIDPIFKYLRHLGESQQLEDYYVRPSDKSPVLPFPAFFKNAVAWCEEQCEEISWKKKPLALKTLLKEKLGTDEGSFEGIPVLIPSYTDGGKKTERCVIFPRSSDKLIELLIKKEVYADEDDSGEDESYITPKKGDDYDEVLAEELKKAEIIEINNMRAKVAQINQDSIDFNA